MQALEKSVRSDDEPSATAGSLTPDLIAVGGIHREMADDLEALGVEITGLRWQAKEYYTVGHSQVLKRLDDLHIGFHNIESKLDQLLKKDNA